VVRERAERGEDFDSFMPNLKLLQLVKPAKWLDKDLPPSWALTTFSLDELSSGNFSWRHYSPQSFEFSS
jgi:hypothetical protein